MVYYYTNNKTLYEKVHEEYKTVEDLQPVVNLLLKEPEIGLDCETTGLDPRKDKVIMVQLSTPTDQYVIDVRGLDFGKIFKPLFDKKDILFIGHNIKFDYNMLKQFGIILYNVYDTMISDIVIFNDFYDRDFIRKNKRFSLDGVFYHYFKSHIPKGVRNEFKYIGASPFTTKQILYGAYDTEVVFKIKVEQAKLIDEYKLHKVVSLENKVVLCLGDIEYNGFYIDPKRWMEANVKFVEKLKVAYKNLDKELIKIAPRYEKKAFQLSLFSTPDEEQDRLTDVNWNSSSQVMRILNEQDIYPVDKDGKGSTSTKALGYLDDKPPLVLALLDVRKYSKAVSAFGKEFLEKNLHDDSRIRSNFNQIVGTGRMSSRNPNMQQIPAGDEFRGAFVAPDGKVLITADYSSQESRVMADLADDESFIDFFNNGDGDMHSFVATKLFSVAFDKEFIVTKDNENSAYRQKGKTLNFMISFGGSAMSLSKELKIPVEEAQILVDSFFGGFPDLDNFFKANREFALKHGYIRTNPITGRIRWIPEWVDYIKLSQKDPRLLSEEEKSQLGSLKGRIGRKAQNTPIQGSSGDMTKTALILARNKLLSSGILPLDNANIKLVQVVHDECVLEADSGFEDTAAKIIKESMEKAGELYCDKVVMKAAPVIGSVWDH
jgi:DNA polymerase-1